jgi:hypothetical protein
VAIGSLPSWNSCWYFLIASGGKSFNVLCVCGRPSVRYGFCSSACRHAHLTCALPHVV